VDPRTPLSSAAKFTHRDLLEFPDDGRRHELIGGVHVVTPAPVTRQQRILGNVYFLMLVHVEHHRGGRAFVSPVDVVLSTSDVVKPDLVFVSDTRQDILTPTWVQGSPDLIVEILSPLTRRRDEHLKRELYERFDVLEYWVVDPETESVCLYRRENGRLERIGELTQGRREALITPLLPGLSLPLVHVFA
jgi:Uma2 family endonuclease